MTEPRNRAVVVFWVLTVALLLGGIGVMVAGGALVMLDEPSPAYALPGVVLGVAYVVLARRLPRSPNPRKDPRGVAWAALVLLPFGSWGAARYLNVALDDGAGEAYPTKVLARPQQRSKRKGRSEDYFLEVEPFLPEHGDAPLRIAVDKSTYRVTKVDDVLTVRVHRGALGYRWLEGL